MSNGGVSSNTTTQPNAAGGDGPVLPTSAQASSSVKSSDQREVEPVDAKIMVIDDEPLNTKVVTKHLRDLGYTNLVTTSDSSQAFAMICGERPDLLLLDIVMPEVSGLDLLRRLRGDARFLYLPVVILTAHSSPSTRREALELGATDFLSKPVEPNELAPRVRNVLFVKAYQDELARRAEQLEENYRQQADELVSARQEGELRYLAGKAEIATDVLHNVGNALNSVNVGVDLVAYTVRESKLDSLKRAVSLLQENKSCLAKFLNKDKRGQMLPAYLVELADALLAEREKITGEIELLAKHLQYINAVVATHQEYAAFCELLEDVCLDKLLDDVEELLGGSFAQGVEVVRCFHNAPVIRTDRQKLLQVMLNVVKNAIESVRQRHEHGLGRVEIRMSRTEADRLLIEVQDNGLGIDPANVLKIFSHGFTTKSDGHGFGLHSCANIVKELGGLIRGSSEGVGCGATFSLELPLQYRE